MDYKFSHIRVPLADLRPSYIFMFLVDSPICVVGKRSGDQIEVHYVDKHGTLYDRQVSCEALVFPELPPVLLSF